MRFSLYLNPQTPGPEHDHRIIGQLIEHAERGVELGYDSLSLTEHHFIDYNTYGNAFVLGAHLAAKMPETTLVTTVTVPPLQHPVELAEKINLLDNLTRGRFIAGLGTGGSPIEFRGFGRTPVDKEAIFFEVVDVVEALWRRRREDPPMQYRTAFSEGEVRGRIIPHAYSPNGPLLGRATVSPGSMADAGRRGWTIITGRMLPDEISDRWSTYATALRESGHPEEHVQRCLDWSIMQKIVHVADTDEEAHRHVAPLLDAMDDVIARSAPGDVPTDANSQRLTVDMRSNRDLFIERATIIGSPETVRLRMQEYMDAGVRNFCTWLWFGDDDIAAVNRSMDLFVHEVRPHLVEPALTP